MVVIWSVKPPPSPYSPGLVSLDTCSAESLCCWRAMLSFNSQNDYQIVSGFAWLVQDELGRQSCVTYCYVSYFMDVVGCQWTTKMRSPLPPLSRLHPLVSLALLVFNLSLPTILPTRLPLFLPLAVTNPPLLTQRCHLLGRHRADSLEERRYCTDSSFQLAGAL